MSRSQAEIAERQQQMRKRLEKMPLSKRARERRTRENTAFARIGEYLARSGKRMEEEHRVTALYSIPSIFVKLAEANKYDISLDGLDRGLPAVETEQRVFGSGRRAKPVQNLPGELIVLPVREKLPVQKDLQAGDGQRRVLEIKKAA